MSDGFIFSVLILAAFAVTVAGAGFVSWLIDSVKVKKVGGIYFWKIGTLGGSFYVCSKTGSKAKTGSKTGIN